MMGYDDAECVYCGTTVSEMDDMCQTQDELDPELEEKFDE
jgi:hypothetical protein